MRRLLRAFLPALCFFSFQALHAQGTGSLRGRVVDAGEKTPIPAAHVRLVEARRVDLSHEDGTFDFDGVSEGTHTLIVQRVGYRPVTRTLEVKGSQVTELTIELSATALQLAPTVVTASADERSSREVLSATSVVSGTALDRQSAGTVAAILQNQPGVSVTSLGPVTARPVIRGLGGDRILMLEDGQRSGDLSALSGDHAVAVEPATARQIEVVRGPMSLLYGSSALGGVVNVVREEIPASRPDRTHGALTLEGASVMRGTTMSGYSVSQVGALAVRGEGSFRRSSDVRTPLGVLINTDARTVNASGAVSWAGAAGHAGASYRYYNSAYGIPGGFVGGHETGVDIRMRRHTVRAEAESRRPLGPFTSVRATATATRYGHEELEPSGALGTEFDQTQLVGELVGRHGAAGPFALGAVGVRAQYRDIATGGTLRTPSTEDYTLAGFLVEEMGKGPLRAQAGLRYDYASYTPLRRTSIFVGGVRVPVAPRDFGAISGSLGVLYDLREVVHFGASINRAYRTPDFNELYSNGPHLAANSFDVGDPRLGQETGLGVDAFVRVDREHIRAEVSVFRNQLDNYIFPSSRGRAELGTQGNRPRFQFTNEDAVFSGAEAQVELALTRRLVVDATTSWVQARFRSARAAIPVFSDTDTTFIAASANPPFIPPLNGNVGLRYDRPRLFGGLLVRWADRQGRTGDFETPTAGYALFGGNLGWRLLSGSRLHTITLRVDNLLNRAYRDHLSRIKEIMPEPGRNVNLLYRLTF